MVMCIELCAEICVWIVCKHVPKSAGLGYADRYECRYADGDVEMWPVCAYAALLKGTPGYVYRHAHGNVHGHAHG